MGLIKLRAAKIYSFVRITSQLSSLCCVLSRVKRTERAHKTVVPKGKTTVDQN